MPMNNPDSDDTAAEALEAVADARRRLAEVPASVVVTNHAMGLFELAAIHLSGEPVRLHDASLAIDALSDCGRSRGTPRRASRHAGRSSQQHSTRLCPKVGTKRLITVAEW